MMIVPENHGETAGEFPHGIAAMGHFILVFAGNFGKGLLIVFVIEQAVVAESAFPVFFGEENGDICMLPLELTHLWCSRPGGLTDTYTIIPIEEFIGRRGEWQGEWDYDKMVSTYSRIRKTHNNE